MLRWLVVRGHRTGLDCRLVRTTGQRLYLTTLRHPTDQDGQVPLISINDADFYRPDGLATGSTQPIFKQITFTLDAGQDIVEQWAIVSPCSVSRTSFLQVLAGQYVVVPASARTYPALSAAGLSSSRAIKYVGFDAERGSRIGGTSLRGAYLSARYESRRENTDFSLRDYLSGHTELNGLEKEKDVPALDAVIQLLNLTSLADMPVSNLSNGQTRRARIAKALMEKPQLLLLDGPFMGLDPRAVRSVSEVLQSVAEKGTPRLVVSLRPQDDVPSWINNLIVIGRDNNVIARGSKDAIAAIPQVQKLLARSETDSSIEPRPSQGQSKPELGEALVEMDGVQVSYGDKTVLGNWHDEYEGSPRKGLWWSLHRGQRCGIFGPNGSGKTTMLSLITSDHPQTYGLPVRIFGRSRLPQPGIPGISVFDLQRRMGHSSPEVHAFFPRQLTVRRTLESAWADAPLARPALDDRARSAVDGFLQAFAAELDQESGTSSDWAARTRFGELNFSSQRLLMFLRAIIAQPDLIILDEAFSGMDEGVRDKAFAFLADGHAGLDDSEASGSVKFGGISNQQALLVVSHAKEDVPDCIREWICLPEAGTGEKPRTGLLTRSLKDRPEGWSAIWDA